LKAELRLEAYNATNHPFFGAPGTNMSSSATFGAITGASNSRTMQAGLKTGVLSDMCNESFVHLVRFFSSVCSVGTMAWAQNLSLASHDAR
jgi:hypothetical protein